MGTFVGVHFGAVAIVYDVCCRFGSLLGVECELILAWQFVWPLFALIHICHFSIDKLVLWALAETQMFWDEV